MYTFTKYSKKIDNKLLDLFYSSIFHERDEIEYVKEPTWVWRYDQFKKHIKIITENKKIIGTLGAIPHNVSFKGNEHKLAVLVDNCIAPEKNADFEVVFGKLFDSTFQELSKEKYAAAIIWDYENKFELHKNFYLEKGFVPLKDINWSIAGIEYNSQSPKKWRGKNKTAVKLLYHLFRLRNHFLIPKKPSKTNGEFTVRDAGEKDIDKISKFISQQEKNNEYVSVYTADDIRKLIKKIGLRILLVEKKGTIIGFASYFISPWTGMMYGKPTQNDWEKFYTITLDEFTVMKEYENTSASSLLLENILSRRYEHPGIGLELSGMVVDLLDKKDEFKSRLFSKYGFIEPAFDKGLFLVKLFDKKFPFNEVRSWHIPNRIILSPTPSEFHEK